MYLILEFLQLYVFQHLVQYMAYQFSAGCMTTHFHFDPILGKILSQSGTGLIFSGYRVAQIPGIVLDVDFSYC